MKPKSNRKILPPAEDELTGALLAEHARLGKKTDEELVQTILLNTVDAPVELARFAPAPPPKFSRGEWLKVAAIVTIIASAAVFLLNRRPGSASAPPPQASQTGRQQETFHLVVKYVEPTQTDRESGAKNSSKSRKRIAARPGARIDVPSEIAANQSGVIQSVKIAQSDFSPPPAEFGHSLEEFPEAVRAVRSSFTLAANETSTSENGGKIVTYRGDVLLRHDQFILEASSLTLNKSGEMPLLIARGVTLIHRDGRYRAESESVVFDPALGELVAHGLTRLVENGVERDTENERTGVPVVFSVDGQVRKGR